VPVERATRRGRVVDFDEHVGLGHVVDDTGAELLFHCVEIADGTRAIDVGATIEFVCLPKLGTYEAGCLRAR
jgi:cold shock CspA family protein